tara:strand:- start:450 stop:1106 length:657 start_codon:yes stop_codon:yes gene_type:complete
MTANLDLENIKNATEFVCNVDVLTKTRKSEFVIARKIFAIVCRQYTDRTLYEIADYIKKDHATILHYEKTYKNWVFAPKVYNKELNLLETVKEKIKLNPFDKYLTKEDKLQNSVINYIKVKYPNVLAAHIPNEGKRTPFERYKLKYLGAVAGMPDIMIFHKNSKYCGLAIELKVGYNKPTENQESCLKRLKKAKWRAEWSNNLDDVLLLIDNYMKDGK